MAVKANGPTPTYEGFEPIDKDVMHDRIEPLNRQIEHLIMMGNDSIEDAISELVEYHHLQEEFYRQLLRWE